MTTPVLTVTPNTPFQAALKLMHEHKVRRLPVVDKHGRLAGIVAERDLLHASPSPISSLSVWEMNYLLGKLTIQQVMTRSIIITTPDTPIEHAASLMVANKIGGLPVVDDSNHVVGIITETDIFRSFVEMLDGQDGIRLTLDLSETEDIPFDLIESIYRNGGKVTAMGTLPHASGRRAVIVLKNLSLSLISQSLNGLGNQLVDVYDLSNANPVIRAEPVPKKPRKERQMVPSWVA
jgi:acetoin utilization protein AcuB